ncbi:MAG: NAD(P)/FAD-dependent oxidoreductase [Chloroflexi bacterium]|nr:NAD(P)/FAD-dependent oxidoreductase [Chloroflexota bacterium]
MASYLIIGNSAGGIAAAEAIRRGDPKGAITMVSDEPYPAYSRPLISDYLAGDVTLEKMLLRPADFYPSHGIEAILGTKVTRLELTQKRATLADGRTLKWDKLLLATGGTPTLPDIKGRDLKGVFVFNTLDDAKAIGDYLIARHRAVVIGGGLIGLSAAKALLRRGNETTVVVRSARLLSTLLDAEASALMEKAALAKGLKVIKGSGGEEILGQDGQVKGVALGRGETIPCEVVILARGVDPRTELAREAGLKVREGIPVNEHMETSAPGVYACGDVAESYDFACQEVRVNPVWPSAVIGGLTAGANMAGERNPCPGTSAVNALSYFGTAIAAAGQANPPTLDGFEVLRHPAHNGHYEKVVLQDGRVVGFILVGNLEKAGVIFSLIKERVDVTPFKKDLISPSFGYAFLPAKLRQARIAAE